MKGILYSYKNGIVTDSIDYNFITIFPVYLHPVAYSDLNLGKHIYLNLFDYCFKIHTFTNKLVHVDSQEHSELYEEEHWINTDTRFKVSPDDYPLLLDYSNFLSSVLNGDCIVKIT